jgi:hypothetical protein
MTNLSDVLTMQGAAIEADDDFDAINALYQERGWGDGLPIVPPTAERVERMLVYCDRRVHETIAKIAPRYGEATPVRLAANAVMAGCRPEYFPLYMLAIEAMCAEPFDLYGIQATTHLCAPLVIVNGPVATELGTFPHDAEGSLRSAPLDTPVPAVQRADDLIIAVIGGAGNHSAFIPTFGATRSVTRALKRSDGSLARNVNDFRRK